MAGSAWAEKLRSRWLRGVVLAIAAVGLWLRYDGSSWWSVVLLAVLAGCLVALVVSVMTPVVFGRALGALAAGAVAIALVTGGQRHWFAALPVGLAAIFVWYRWHGTRTVDATPRDRTLVPFSFDDGDRLVDALDAVWGSTRSGGPRHHLGLRAAHSHGSVVTGTWARDNSCVTPANVPLFTRPNGTVVARFSNFSGELERDDRRHLAHGLALELEAEGTASFTVVLVDIRRFPVATREDFVAFTRCQQAGGLRELWGIARLVVFSRVSLRALLGSTRWPRIKSYADRTYHGLNSFYCRLGGREVPVRYLVEPIPDGGGAALPPTGAFPRTQLDNELQARLGSGRSVCFDVYLVLGQRNGVNFSEDLVCDPTRWWGRGREKKRLCTVMLKRYVATEGPDRWLFQPFDLPEGFRPSDDEILSARRTAYATSYLRRCPLHEVAP